MSTGRIYERGVRKKEIILSQSNFFVLVRLLIAGVDLTPERKDSRWIVTQDRNKMENPYNGPSSAKVRGN